MFESLILIVDRLISLVRTREENKRKVFQEIVEPVFQESQKAYDDYCRYLEAVRKIVIAEIPLTNDQVDTIRTRRNDQASLRTKIRSLSTVYCKSSSDEMVRDFFQVVEKIFSPPGESEVQPGTLDDWRLVPEALELEIFPTLGSLVESENSRQHLVIESRPGTGRTNMLWILRLLEASAAAEPGLQPDIYRVLVAKIIAISQVDAEVNWKRLCRLYGELRLKLTMPA